MTLSRPSVRTLAGAAAAALFLAGCGAADDGASVRTIGGDGASSGSASASASGSASVPSSASASGSTASGAAGTDEASGALGGYTPVSDVASHARVVLDVCAVNELLDADPIDLDAVAALYRDGEHSVKGDGTARTLAGFAASERDEPVWDDYVVRFGDETWLDTFVSDAIAGTGAFAGESDAVHRQGVQKGLQNQVLVAWTLHELVAAQEKAAAGDLDPAEGAPHNWDEAWAFYHGADPSCAPFATADKRGENFGTGSAVNDAILAAMQDGQEALVEGDVDGARVAAEEIQRQLTITYLQASIRYGHKIDDDLAAGDDASARTHQAEGWAFFRVIEPWVAAVDAGAADTVAGVFDLSAAPAAGAGATVEEALASVYDGLGITPDEIGTLAS